MNRCVLSLAAAAAMTLAAPPAWAQSTAVTPATPSAVAEEATSTPAAATVLRALQRMFRADPAPAASPIWREIEMRSPQLKPGPTCGLIVTPPDPRLDPKLARVSMERPRHLGMRSVPVFCR
jgi:hypothetical protein